MANYYNENNEANPVPLGQPQGNRGFTKREEMVKAAITGKAVGGMTTLEAEAIVESAILLADTVQDYLGESTT